MAGKVLIRINLFIFAALAIINFLGVLMPELGFDALWYHLTLSKLFLFKGQWYFPGGLFYYSSMPRLAELISLPLFQLFESSGPKFIQFTSGLITSLLIYRLTNKLIAKKLLSLIAMNLFYATWLVSWQSSSAYVDLVRTLFEVSALYFLTSKPSTVRWKLISGICLGLSIGTKWHAIGSLFLFTIIFSPVVILPALLIASPWFYVANHFTGNPVYPLFEKFMSQTQMAQVPANFYSPLVILKRFLLAPVFITRPSEDFLSPVIGLVFILSILALFSSKKLIRKISLLGILGTFLLLLTPPPSTRYYLPYMPAVIIAAIYVISKLKEKISIWLIALFTISSFLILSLRLIALAKYLPYLSGRVTLNQFLSGLSHRLPDTFIDTDDFVKNNLPPDAKYLISNLHNLYYFPYNFDHESFADQNKRYDYLITKGVDPKEINGKLVHQNKLGIQIFKL